MCKHNRMNPYIQIIYLSVLNMHISLSNIIFFRRSPSSTTSENKQTNIQTPLKHNYQDAKNRATGKEDEIHNEATTSGVNTDVGNRSSDLDNDDTDQDSDEAQMRAQVEHEYDKLAVKHEYERLKHMTDPNLTFDAIQVAASNKSGKSGKKKIDLQSKLRKTSKKTTKGRDFQDKAKLDDEGNLLGYEKMEWLDGYVNRDVGNGDSKSCMLTPNTSNKHTRQQRVDT